MLGHNTFRLTTRCFSSLLPWHLPRASAAQGSADVVLEWNRILNTALATPGAVPPTVFVTRPAAIVHDRSLRRAELDRLPGTMPYVIGGQRCRRARRAMPPRHRPRMTSLVALMPSLTATFDAALAATISAGSDAGVRGSRCGRRIDRGRARSWRRVRTTDGIDRTSPYILPNAARATGSRRPPANRARRRSSITQNVQGFILCQRPRPAPSHRRQR